VGDSFLTFSLPGGHSPSTLVSYATGERPRGSTAQPTLLPAQINLLVEGTSEVIKEK